MYMNNDEVRLSEAIQLSRKHVSVDMATGMNNPCSLESTLDSVPSRTEVIVGQVSDMLDTSDEAIDQIGLDLVQIRIPTMRQLGGQDKMIVQSIRKRQGFVVDSGNGPRSGWDCGGHLDRYVIRIRTETAKEKTMKDKTNSAIQQGKRRDAYLDDTGSRQGVVPQAGRT